MGGYILSRMCGLFLVGDEMIATFDLYVHVHVWLYLCVYLCFLVFSLCVPLVFRGGNISSIYRPGRWFSDMFCVLGMLFLCICVYMSMYIYIYISTHTCVCICIIMYR